jgi:hypothetical protein
LPLARLFGVDARWEAGLYYAAVVQSTRGNGGVARNRFLLLTSWTAFIRDLAITQPTHLLHTESSYKEREIIAMSFSSQLLTTNYFPLPADKVPFGDMLNQIFFLPLPDNEDFPIHGPNVIRFIEALVGGTPDSESGLVKSGDKTGQTMNIYRKFFYQDVIEALEVNLGSPQASIEKSKIIELLKAAALYHDIGKSIRRANHPQIGSNLLRNFSEQQSRKLVDILVHDGESENISAKYNRFSLIDSIIQHHDKFGVACTGEGGLPLFSDVMYFTSDETTINGIKKNLTSVMLMNLADIAAVNVASRDKKNCQ